MVSPIAAHNDSHLSHRCVYGAVEGGWTNVARFTVTDVFGRTVVGPFAAWEHVVGGHAAMADFEDLVKAAISRPKSVHQTSDVARRLFRGSTIVTGFWRSAFPCVVVEYDRTDVGYLRTAYLSTLEPRGKVIWP
jgi:hypothetical protein